VNVRVGLGVKVRNVVAVNVKVCVGVDVGVFCAPATVATNRVASARSVGVRRAHDRRVRLVVIV